MAGIWVSGTVNYNTSAGPLQEPALINYAYPQ